jgi:hypothetical protein
MCLWKVFSWPKLYVCRYTEGLEVPRGDYRQHVSIPRAKRVSEVPFLSLWRRLGLFLTYEGVLVIGIAGRCAHIGA